MAKLSQTGITVDWETFGDEQIAFSYLRLANKPKKNLLINSATKVLRPIAKTAKTNLRSRNKKKTGNLLHSVRVARFDTKTATGAYVKARRVKNKYKGFHSYLIDQGTKMRKTASGRSTGQVKGTKWWEDAVNTHIGRLDGNFEKEIERGMAKIMLKELRGTMK